ncbi:MAG: hypothetical protein J6D08_08430 [Lachnospiraceae bacterium]|nr:hypothetical protein [Lachnospiraceae bacterium]
MVTRFRLLKKAEGAYLTVYLSLIFGIVLSLLLALIEGAAIGAVRAQAELVADLGLDSVFAEYHREILNQYELFFIDSSYGGANGGVGMVEAHLSDYMSYNMNPEKELLMLGEETLLKLENPYLEIQEVSYASDDDCMVWKAQAVAYMKAVYGGDIISRVKEHMDTVESNGLTDRDVAAEVSEQKRKFEEALAENQIIEFGGESEEGFSYQKVSGVFDELIGGGLLMLVLPQDDTVSGAIMDEGPYFSSRMKNGKINQGIGLHEGMERPDGMIEELIYGEYLMKMCGCYTQPKEQGLLKYQIEYILYGKNSDAANLRSSVELLFGLRAASNLTSIFMDSKKKSEAEAAATALCSLLAVPQLSEALTAILISVWALAEAAVDVHQLLDGGRVPLTKKNHEWNTSLTGLFSGNLFGGGKNMTGLSYQDYLRVFLGIMDKNDKAVRSLDVVEMDIRQTEGNESFRIDRCIDFMKVNFGFADSSGHDFVFQKRMCYE